jgi:aminocarboxymuconate-semialdehyde decarboxylase
MLPSGYSAVSDRRRVPVDGTHTHRKLERDPKVRGVRISGDLERGVPIEAGVAIVDVHAHHFAAGLPDYAVATGDDRWPSLVLDDTGVTGRIMLGDTVFRKVQAPLWDLAARTAELDLLNVAVQVISPVPIMLTYWGDPAVALDHARAVNDSLAAAVQAAHGRLAALGTVPLQDVGRAVLELRRLVGELGLSGVQIGTQIAGRELDDPALRPFFAAAAELDAAVFIHPLDGGGNAIRRRGQPYDFGLGMLTDTAMAAIGLISGGVLGRFPTLRIGLAHGCGTFAWAYPRLRIATQLTDNPGLIDRFDDLVHRLWVDTLVFDPEHLRLLAKRFGDGHVMLGTDYPFIAGQLDGARDLLSAAVDDGALSDVQAKAVLTANALDFIHHKGS